MLRVQQGVANDLGAGNVIGSSAREVGEDQQRVVIHKGRAEKGAAGNLIAVALAETDG